MTEINYYQKYLKYKNKYLELKSQIGGTHHCIRIPSRRADGAGGAGGAGGNLAAILLITKRGSGPIRYLVLRKRDSGGKWMIPGGKIETGEKPFDAMKREFKEEVGSELPKLKYYKCVDFEEYSTRIYLGFTNEEIGFIANKEADCIRFFEKDRLVHGDPAFKGELEFINYVKETIQQMLPEIIPTYLDELRSKKMLK